MPIDQSSKQYTVTYQGGMSPDRAGFMVIPGSTSVPSGWLLCNGQAVSRTTYADLFTAIGTAFGGGDGSTTFNLPNLTITINSVNRTYIIKAFNDVTSAASVGLSSIGGAKVDTYLDYDTTTTPANPAAGDYRTYFKSDGILYKLDSAGNETKVGSDITLPVSSTDNAIVRWSGAGGNSIKNSTVTIDDSGNMVVTGDLAVNGGDITSSTTTFNLLDSTVTTLNFGRGATNLTIGATSGTTTIRNANTVVNGALTANSTFTVTSVSNQFVIGSTRTVTLNAPTPAASSLTHTIPDVGTNANFVMSEGTQTIAGPKTFSSPMIANRLTSTAQIGSEVQIVASSGSSQTINFEDANVHRIVLTANCNFTFNNPIAGFSYLLILVQDGSGSKTVTWPTIRWRGGTPPTLSAGANAIDLVSIIWDGTNYYGTASLSY